MKLAAYTQGRDNNFNLVRMIAAFSVLVGHSLAVARGVFEYPQFGTFGVDVFFICSGFLVTASLLARKTAVEFITARVLRIYPALVVMVLLVVLVLGPLLSSASVAGYFHSPETWRYLWKNCTLVTGVSFRLPGVFESNSYSASVNGALWTLPFELAMYALLAAVYFLLSAVPGKQSFTPTRYSAAIVIIVLLSGIADVLARYQEGMHGTFAHLCFLFFSGSLYYQWRDRIRLETRWFVAAVLALAITSLHSNLFLVSYNLLLPYCLLYLAYVPAGMVRHYNRLGDYSYGTYIYTSPIQQSLVALMPGISGFAVLACSAVLSLVCAVLSWHVLEKKALAMKEYFAQRVRRVLQR